MELANTDGAGGGAGGGGNDGGDGGGASAAAIFGISGGDGGAGGGADTTAGAGGSDTVDGGGAGWVDPGWYDQVSADPLADGKPGLRDWLKSAGVKDIQQLATIARDNQVALRESGRVKVPGEGAKPEEIAAFHKAIGVPDDAKGYQVAEIKDANGEPVPLNTPLLERLATTAHQAGVPKGAYEALVNDFVQSQLEELATANTAEQTEANAKVKEWGGQANTKIAAIDNFMRTVGISGEEALKVRGALGAGRTMDLFAKLGEGLAEDVLVTGKSGSNRFGITAAQAQEQINAMRADPQQSKAMMLKGTPERARYDRLQDIIGQEANRKAAAGE